MKANTMKIKVKTNENTFFICYIICWDGQLQCLHTSTIKKDLARETNSMLSSY